MVCSGAWRLHICLVQTMLQRGVEGRWSRSTVHLLDGLELRTRTHYLDDLFYGTTCKSHEALA